ncbi:uncharacterized protein LOC113318182 [Papaver somniferum]|uniref:uncharacterized protein LOC113318182 n=1 Tax=Papaver somniferum TaxID=3469 RepID=UPI000E6FF908|nr:uncharacterized protein LOC113318182 [Papaver somniferum]
MESDWGCDKKRKGDDFTSEKKDKKRKGDDFTSEKKDKKRKEDEIDTWKRRYSDLMERFKILDKVEARNVKLKKILDHQEHRNSVLYASFKEKEEECRELEDKLRDLYERCYYAEQDFNEYTFMFDELCQKIEGFKKKIGQFEFLTCSKNSAKISEYRKQCSEMHEKIRGLEEDKRVVIEKGLAEQEYLENQAMFRLKYELELEKKSDGYRTKYNELCMRYKEKKARVTSLENEVKENKGLCVQLNERIASLEEERKVMCEVEKKAQVRITYLEKLLGKRMKSDKRDLKLPNLGLDEENSTLRCSVGSPDYGERESDQRGLHNENSCNDKRENDIYGRLRSEMNGGTHEAYVARTTFTKKMMNNAEKILTSAFRDSNNFSSQGNKDAHVSGTVEICDNKDENISLRRICHSGGRGGMQVSTGNRTERCLKKPLSDQIGEVYDSSCDEDDTPLFSAVKGRRFLKIVTSDGEEDDTTLLGELQEKVLEELTVIPKLKLSPTDLCAWNSSNVALSSGGQNVEEFVSPSGQRQVSLRKREEKKSQADETFKNVKDILAPNDLEMSASPAQVKIGNPTSENDEQKVAQEAGSEREGDTMGGCFENISPRRVFHSGGTERMHVSTGNRTERCLKKTLSDQIGEVSDSSCEEDDSPLSSAVKGRRFLKIVTSDGEENDTTLLGVLQEKVLDDLTVFHKLKFSPMNLCAWNSSNVALSSGGQNVEEFVSPSHQRQVSPRKHEEKKSQADETFKNVKDILAPNNREMSVSSAQGMIGNLTSENDEEKVAQEAGCESEDDSMGGRFAKGLDSGDSSSDSEDAVDIELDFGRVVAMMRSNTNIEMKWQNEADMRSSFEKDPVLCMKAVCALHRQQADDGKSIKGPFSQFSALSGSDLAEFLMDWNPEADLEKSVKELEMFDREGLEDCKTLATYYSKQLFSIYQKGEDPFFNPSYLRLTA